MRPGHISCIVGAKSSRPSRPDPAMEALQLRPRHVGQAMENNPSQTNMNLVMELARNSSHIDLVKKD
jgi:hypothetical protein